MSRQDNGIPTELADDAMLNWILDSIFQLKSKGQFNRLSMGQKFAWRIISWKILNHCWAYSLESTFGAVKKDKLKENSIKVSQDGLNQWFPTIKMRTAAGP